MFLSSIADNTRLSITARIRVIFSLFTLVSVSYFLLEVFENSPATDWHYVYDVLFAISALSCAWFVWRPTIGSASLHLFPLMLVSIIRLVDITQNYWSGDITLKLSVRAAFGWSALIISVGLVDLFESKIYHRMVLFLEQETE